MIKAKKFGRILSLLSLRIGVAPPKTKNANVTLDLAIHDIDIFNLLLNQLPQSVSIQTQKVINHNQADAAAILLKYSKCAGVIQSNWITPIKIRKLIITGTELFAQADYINQSIVTLKKVQDRPTSNFLDFTNFSDIPVKEIFVSKKEPLKEELKFFLSHHHLPPQIDLVKSAVDALSLCLNS
jgi:UDP-N-acetylglucosamine 3-dehydrogenase